MNGNLFNVLGILTKVKDFLTETGSPTFHRMQEVLALLADAAGRVAAYIDNFGSATTPVGASAVPGSGLDGPRAQQDMADLVELYSFAKAQHEMELPAAAPADPQRGPFAGVLGKLSPEFKKFAWGVVTQIITQVLVKSGVSIPGMSTTGTAATEKPTAEKPPKKHG